MAAWSWAGDGVVAVMASPTLSAAEKLDWLRQYFHSLGALAPLAYVAMIVVEVVIAPIPGTMLYAPGGALFGGFWGGLLSLVGNVLGAGLACELMRRVGRPFAESYLQGSTLRQYEGKIADRGLWIVFLLRVNPLTSSDFVSYASGLTRMPTWKLMLGTLLGMAPLCWAQAYLSQGIFTAFPSLLYPFLAACVVYVALILWIIRRLLLSPSDAMTNSPNQAKNPAWRQSTSPLLQRHEATDMNAGNAVNDR